MISNKPEHWRLAHILTLMKDEEYRYVLSKWRWIVFGAVMSCCMAFLLLSMHQESYIQTGTLLSGIDNGTPITISGDANSDAINSILEFNNDVSTGSLNELCLILRSRKIIAQVVDILDLQTTYKTYDGLKPRVLFEMRPFTVEFSPTANDIITTFTATLTSGDELALSRFKMDGEAVNVPKTIKFDVPLATPYGNVIFRKADTNSNFTNRNIKVVHTTREAAIARYYHAVHTDIVGGTSALNMNSSDLIRISCTDDNPFKASAVVHTLIGAYRNDIIQSKDEKARIMSRYVDNRLDSLSTKLNLVQTEIAELKRNNTVMAYEGNLRLLLRQSNQVEERRHIAESKIAVLASIKNFLDAHIDKNELLPMIDDMDRDLLLSINAYNTLMTEYMRLMSPEAGSSSILQNFNHDLALRRKAIGISVNTRYESLQKELTTIRHQSEQLKKLMAVRPEGAVRYDDLLREQKILEDLYLYQLNTREEINMQLAISVQNVREVESSDPEVASPTTDSRKWYAIALLIGIGLPIFLLYTRAGNDSTLHNRKEVEKATSLPVVGEIPERKQNSAEGSLVTSAASDAPLLEAFRLLRFNLDFVRHGKNVILLTSSTSGQGKSFTSRNLSAVCALTGKKVLLIDADIRKLTQSKLAVGKNATAGLTSYLQGSVGRPADIIIKDALAPGLDFIPGGMIPPNPAELLMRPALKELIDSLRPLYDYIFIDTTPAFAVADAQAIATHCDLTLYVVRIGIENRFFLYELDRIAREQRFPRMNIVINGLEDNEIHRTVTEPADVRNNIRSTVALYKSKMKKMSQKMRSLSKKQHRTQRE